MTKEMVMDIQSKAYWALGAILCRLGLRFLSIESSNSFYSKCCAESVSDQHCLILSISTRNCAFPDRTRVAMDADVVTILICFFLLQTSLSRLVREATKKFQFYKESNAAYCDRSRYPS